MARDSMFHVLKNAARQGVVPSREAESGFPVPNHARTQERRRAKPLKERPTLVVHHGSYGQHPTGRECGLRVHNARNRLLVPIHRCSRLNKW